MKQNRFYFKWSVILFLVFAISGITGCGIMINKAKEIDLPDMPRPDIQKYLGIKKIKKMMRSGDDMPEEDMIEFKYWNNDASKQINNLIYRYGNQTPPHYAVFEADHTIWNGNINEALLAYMESNKKISLKKIKKNFRIIPFNKNEGLYSYYLRLCDIDPKIGAQWCAQVFADHSLKTIKPMVDKLFELTKPISVKLFQGNKLIEGSVMPPAMYPAQKELINSLMQNGIDVFIVTSSLEEIVRMVVSDSKYGLRIPPERVIGVNVVLKAKDQNMLTTSRRQIGMGQFFNKEYDGEMHNEMRLTNYLYTPATWYGGKVASILEYIHPIKKPVMAAGHSLNDQFMLFHVNDLKYTLRLWVDHDKNQTEKIKSIIADYAEEQKMMELPITADKGWLYVSPDKLQ